MLDDIARKYLRMAEEISLRSTCIIRRVGSVIVRNDLAISTGWSGIFSHDATDCIKFGCPRCSMQERRSEKAYDYCICMHAEQSAICLAAKNGVALDGTALFSTLRPCLQCLCSAISVGVQYVAYSNQWSYEDEVLEQMHSSLRSKFAAFVRVGQT